MLAIYIAIVIQGRVPEGLTGHWAVRVSDSTVVGGGYQHEKTWSYELRAGKWSERAKCPLPASFAAASKWKSYALVFGGLEDSGRHSRAVLAFDPKADKWSVFSEMPERMSRHALANWNGRIYLAGGFNGETESTARNSANLWEFRPDQKQWRKLAAMSVARHGLQLVPYKGRIWAIGGHAGNSRDEGMVESYDPASNTWRKEFRLSRPRGFFGAISLKNGLVLFGGAASGASVVQWTSNGWKPRREVLNRRRFAFIQNNNEVTIIGGEPAQPNVLKLTIKD